MSDFINDFWGWYVGIITIVSIVACVILVKWMEGGNEGKKEGPAESMGHVWDEDLSELNNPLPSWWKNMFYVTLAFGAGYLVLYPGLGFYSGMLGWSGIGQMKTEVQMAEAEYGLIYEKFDQMSVKALGSDPEAMKIGERLYLTYCTGCHGSDAGGVPGFPNLRDGDWLWGDSPEQIKASIKNGRKAVMPAWEGPLGGEQGVQEVTQYVLSLSDRPDLEPKLVEAGKGKYQAFCAGCHMPNAKGNPALGAPNLTDNVWLYGGHARTVAESIAKGRQGVMPAHGEFLGEQKVHLLSGYIYHISR